MALKALMLRKKLTDVKKALDEARAKTATFETREAELEQAISEAETDEEKQAVEEEVEKFETEKKEHDEEVSKLENDVAAIEKDLADTEAEQPKPAAKPEERGERKTMTTRKFYGMDMQERDRFFADDGVKNFLGEIRSCIKEKRALTNVGLTVPEVMLPLIRTKVEETSKLVGRVNLATVSGKARTRIIGTIPEAIWTEMVGTLNELDLKFYDDEVDGYKVGGFIPVPNSILEDNDVDLASTIIDALGKAIGKALDKAIVYGTGTKMPLGIVTRLAQAAQPETYSATDNGTVDGSSIDDMDANKLTNVDDVVSKTESFKSIKTEVLTVTGELQSASGKIGELETNKLDSETARITYATIENLKGLSGEFEQFKTNDFTAITGKVNDLTVGVEKVNTLMFGSATGESITTDFANSVISMIGIAQIKDSMIDSLDAKKIKALDVDTTDVKVHSKDGKSQWRDNTIQISDSTRLRVQIGKDASGDYNMYVWDSKGSLMFDALGLTEQGVQRKIIRNDMVKEDANISAGKLDIGSLFEVINKDGSHTLKSNKIYFDDASQTLNVLLQDIKTSSGKDYSEWGSLLKQSDDFITQKLWWTENIDGTSVKEKFSNVNQTLQEYSVSLSNMAKYDDEIYLISYVPTKDNYPAWDWCVPVYPSDTQFPREETWQYNDTEWDKYIGKIAYWENEGSAWRFIRNEDGSHGWKEIPNSETAYMLRQNSALRINIDSISNSLSLTQQDLKGNYSTTTQMNNAITQAVSAESGSIKSEISRTYVTSDMLSESLNGIDESIGNLQEEQRYYTKTEQLDNYIKQLITDDTTETSIVLSGEYATKSYADKVGTDAIATAGSNTNKILESYSTTAKIISEINPGSTSISAAVTAKLGEYATSASLTAFIKNENGQLRSAIEAIADDITLNASGAINISGNKSVNINGNLFTLNSTNTTIDADGTIRCDNLISSNAKITGGSINIETDTSTYSAIKLSYGDAYLEESPYRIEMYNPNVKTHNNIDAHGVSIIGDDNVVINAITDFGVDIRKGVLYVDSEATVRLDTDCNNISIYHSSLGRRCYPAMYTHNPVAFDWDGSVLRIYVDDTIVASWIWGEQRWE